MNARRMVSLGLAAALFATSIPAMADHDGGREGGRGAFRGGWHGEIGRFERGDIHTWRAGRWRHEMHDGRLGWWWIVGGMWYFYPQPVYPYPDAYIPPAVIVQTPAAPAPQAVAQLWYYCEASKGYYPYVSSCPGNWQVVPATPPGAPVR